MRVQKIPTLQQTYTGFAAKLMLEDGTTFDGIGFGYRRGEDGIWAYYPMEDTYKYLAPTVARFLDDWFAEKLTV